MISAKYSDWQRAKGILIAMFPFRIMAFQIWFYSTEEDRVRGAGTGLTGMVYCFPGKWLQHA